MNRRTIHSDVYGKIVYREDCWKIKEKLSLQINGRNQIILKESIIVRAVKKRTDLQNVKLL